MNTLVFHKGGTTQHVLKMCHRVQAEGIISSNLTDTLVSTQTKSNTRVLCKG